MWANYIHAHSKEITHGPDVAANWISDGNKLAERWWFV
jgi:peptide/nickel transport system substrate-binding protein